MSANTYLQWNTKSTGHIGWEVSYELLEVDGKVYRAHRKEGFDARGNRLNRFQDLYTKSVSPDDAYQNYMDMHINFPEFSEYINTGESKYIPREKINV